MSDILLSANGQPLHCFGAKAWKQFEHKGYIISLEMVAKEPAMVIWPASALKGNGVYAVCMSAFPYWITEQGRPTQLAFTMAAKGLLAMERQPLDMEVRTLVDVVLRHIPDVYRMPAFKTKRAKMFDTETIVEGRKVAEASV